MSSPSDPAARLIALEEKLTFLEHHVGQLDEVVREMHGTLEMLRQDVTVLLDATRRQSRLAESGPEPETPTPDAEPS